ncbi:unnamed protein product [Aphanomyces euteiches]
MALLKRSSSLPPPPSPRKSDDSYVNGVPNLWHPSHVGLMITYAGVGVLHGAFPRTVYPFFRMYLNMDGYQVAACASMIDMAWSFKLFFGLVTDCVPVWGFRRRPYVLLGWIVCLFFLLTVAHLPPDAPYFAKGEIVAIPNVTLRHVINPTAPADGTKYILLLMGASMGYVMADVACDAAMVELAQTERQDVRGHTQSWSYIIKYCFASLSMGAVGLAMNGQEYGGTFTWSVPMSTVMWVLSLTVAAVLPAVVVFPDAPPRCVLSTSLRAKCNEMFAICTQRAIWQTMWFHYLNAFLSDMQATPSSIVASDWAHVEPINDSIFSMLSAALMALGMAVTNAYFLGTDWRLLVAITTIGIVAVDATVTTLTVYDVVRNEWFFLGAPVVNSLAQGVRFVVTGFVTVEVTDAGHEGATYGLVTTVSNLASPLAVSISKIIDSAFQVYQADIDADTPQVRNQVEMTFVIAYVMRLLSLVTLVLLPPQKPQAQALKREGGKQPWMAVLTLVVMACSLLYGVVTNLLTIFPETACLPLAGGRGCD